MYWRFSDTDRWEWYGAGDKSVAPSATTRPTGDNAPERVLWEMGLVVAIPLILAAIASVVLG